MSKQKRTYTNNKLCTNKYLMGVIEKYDGMKNTQVICTKEFFLKMLIKQNSRMNESACL